VLEADKSVVEASAESFPPPKARHRRVLVRVALGLAPLALGGLAVLGWDMAGRHYTVEEGRLYRCAARSPESLVAFCKERGIRTVIDFRFPDPAVATEAQALAAIGVRHLNLATDQIPPDSVVERFLEIMDDRSNDPVLIHCTHGVGRSGLFMAIYRMEYQGWSQRKAWLEALAVASFGSFRPGSAKERYLFSYQTRANRLTAPTSP
jgi:hypothetical protein